MDDFVMSFVELTKYAVPYCIVWRIGIYIVTTLLDCITGGKRGNGKLEI